MVSSLRRSTLLPVLLLLLVPPLAACSPSPGGAVPGAAGGPWRGAYVDVIRRVAAGATGAPRPVTVFDLEEDSRRTLRLDTPSNVVLPLPDHLGACRLRFGVTPAPTEDGSLRPGAAEIRVKLASDVREEVVFRQRVEDTGRWQEHVVELPRNLAGLRLLLESDLPEEGGPTFSTGWSSPHLECDVSSRDPARAPLVVLVSIDTLRASHLDLYGYPRPTAPRLAELAEDSVVFERAFAPAPYTLSSHASMLTGLMPEVHRAGYDTPNDPLPEEIQTLAETLSAAGYRTVGITAGGLMSEKFGVGQGFAEWHQLTRGNLPSVLPLVFDALEHDLEHDLGHGLGEDDAAEAAAQPRPTFLLLHTYDVHGPYQQPRGHRQFRGDGETGTSPEAAERWRAIQETRYHGYQELGRFSSPQQVVDAYDSGIRFVDAQIGQLVRFLRRTGRYDGALLVVTSDHGESLYDRQRYFGHSHTLTDHELRVPLLVKLPGGAEAGRRDELVHLADVAPLILARAGVRSPTRLDGRDPLTADQPRSSVRGISPHLGSLWARSDEWKLITEAKPEWVEARAELFGDVAALFPTDNRLHRLSDDPEESRNLLGTDQVSRPARRLAAELRPLPAPGRGADTAGALDEETQRNLRALGYLQ